MLLVDSQFEANFEVSLLCNFLAWTFCLCFFSRFFTYMMISLSLSLITIIIVAPIEFVADGTSRQPASSQYSVYQYQGFRPKVPHHQYHLPICLSLFALTLLWCFVLLFLHSERKKVKVNEVQRSGENLWAEKKLMSKSLIITSDWKGAKWREGLLKIWRIVNFCGTKDPPLVVSSL